MNLQRLSSRNMFLRASVLSKLVSTPSRMPTSIQSAQSHRFMGDYSHLWKCQMTSFFSPQYGKLLKNSMRISTNAKSLRPTHHCSAGKINLCAFNSLCILPAYGRSAFTVIDEFNRSFRIHSRSVSQASERYRNTRQLCKSSVLDSVKDRSLS